MKNKPSREKDKPKKHILKKKEEASHRPVKHFLKYFSRKTHLCRNKDYPDMCFLLHPVKNQNYSNLEGKFVKVAIPHGGRLYRWALFPLPSPDSPDFEPELERLRKRLPWKGEFKSSIKEVELFISGSEPGIEEP